MPICYDINISFERGDDEGDDEGGRIPFQHPSPHPLTPEELDRLVPDLYRDWVAKVTGSDPSRIPYFGRYQSHEVISIYEC